ncbi:Uncharacterized protein C30C11.4 [Toxocara canis]|uniref:Uncharacterized protein C30C11.4 n=1 Tax=Toxocara canis TaxID=6265 RepID=A0A0B2V674_TOXCA|nr:Uncharacterized protein C30C11.4 [Toxocara canis]
MEVDSSARGDQKNENKEGDAKEKEGKDDQVVNGPTENKPKTKTIAIDLPIEEHTPSIANVPALVQLELSMQATDRHEKEKVDAKNAVEEYVYYMRDKLADSFAEFITPKDADSFQSMLSATEDWLYDEGEDTEKNVYEAKLAELRKIGDPIQERHREHENRRGAFDDFDRAIIRARKAYEEYSKGSEKYAHIESKDMEKVISAVEEKKRWLDEQRGRQERHPKTDAPVIFVYQITQEQEKFESIVLPILNKPKPKPKKEAKKESKPAPKGEGRTADEQATPAGKAPPTAGEGAANANATSVDMEVD